jgi:hypothetical protein
MAPRRRRSTLFPGGGDFPASEPGVAKACFISDAGLATWC